MTGESVVLAQIILPPSEERCFTAHCSQKACCDLFVRVAGAEFELVPEPEEEVYAFPLCQAHLLWIVHGIAELAAERFPPDEPVDVPPWERSE